MKQLQTQIEIDAPAKRVWEVLTDFASRRAGHNLQAQSPNG
jgi:uncharacterized protein YndB with AHSA1/START domain